MCENCDDNFEQDQVRETEILNKVYPEGDPGAFIRNADMETYVKTDGNALRITHSRKEQMIGESGASELKEINTVIYIAGPEVMDFASRVSIAAIGIMAIQETEEDK